MPQQGASAQPYSIARLRRSAVVFLGAKGLTAPLNLFIFLFIASHLSRPEFALYAWLLAFGQISHQLSLCGLNWIALHHVPYYRTRVGGQSYRLFVLAVVGLRFAVIAAFVAAYLVATPYLVSIFGHSAWAMPLRLYLAVLAAELAVEFLRSCIFEPLLEQGVSQANVLLQHSVFFAFLLLANAGDHSSLSIERVLFARGVAVWIALVVGLGQLAYLLRQPAAETVGEQPRNLVGLARFALDNYAQDVMRLAAMGPLMTMLASRLVGVANLATFGFAQNLAAYLDRFLPAQLFLGLLRPRVIAAYGDDRSFDELRRRIGLILKVSSCGLATATALLVSVGPAALALLSGGRYASSYGLLLTFVLLLAIASVQRMQSVLTNVLGHSELLRRASLASLLVVPTAVALVYAGAGNYGLVLAMIVGESVATSMVARDLRQAGYGLSVDASGYATIAGATIASVVVGRLFLSLVPTGLWSVAAGAAMTLASFALVLRVLRPFSPAERVAIESLLGRKMVLL